MTILEELKKHIIKKGGSTKAETIAEAVNDLSKDNTNKSEEENSK